MRPTLLLLLGLALPVGGQQPAAEPRMAGSFDFGYRWVDLAQGDLNTYRSVVNLGEGPKLFGLGWIIHDPARRLFDRLEVRAHSWGGDPYQTGQIEATREGVYRLSYDYRNIAYFNFLPSFANPALDRGGLMTERGFDIHRRNSALQLDLLPGRRITPYMAYSRDSGSGNGTTVFYTSGDEFPVATRFRDQTEDFRGGLRLDAGRLHLTLEQGGTRFKDDQDVLFLGRNEGNVATTLLGQQLFLADLNQAYGVRGRSIYSKAQLTSNPVSWAVIRGQFLYSRPRSETRYSQTSAGNLFLLSTLQFYNTGQATLLSDARFPHSSGSLGAELRPWRRLRVVELWQTDRLHNAATAVLSEQFLLGASVIGAGTPTSADRLVWNYNQQQLDLFFDVTSKLTLRGGHRYVWGDARVRPGQVSSMLERESGELRRQVALAGLHLRARRRSSVNVDFEGSPGDRAYFRSSLQRYQKARIQVRSQVIASLSLSANISVLHNENPAPAVRYDLLHRQQTLAAAWTPGGGNRVSVVAEYTRYTLRSSLGYLAPSTRTAELSFYRDNGHVGTSAISLVLPPVRGGQARLSFGGSLAAITGSRPTRYYQPLARLGIPLGKRVEWNSEWRWYSLSQEIHSVEGFRTHLFVTGLRLTFKMM